MPELVRPIARSGNMPLLTVKGLKTHFQTHEGTVRAVDGVDFTLGEGESLGLAGESGCGKTTAALSIMRLLPSNGKIVDGTIDYVGYDLAKVTEGQLRGIRWPQRHGGDMRLDGDHVRREDRRAGERAGRLQERETPVYERPDRGVPGHRRPADPTGVHPRPLAVLDQPAGRLSLPSAMQVCVAAVRRPGTGPRPGRRGPLRGVPPEHHDTAAERGDVRWPARRTWSCAISASGSRSPPGSSRRCARPRRNTCARSTASTAPSGGERSAASWGQADAA